jgi:hypothetical protein
MHKRNNFDYNEYTKLDDSIRILKYEIKLMENDDEKSNNH